MAPERKLLLPHRAHRRYMDELATLLEAAIGSLVAMTDLTTTLALRTLNARFTWHVDVFAAFPHSITEGRVPSECHEALEDAIGYLAYEHFRFAARGPSDLADAWNNMLWSHFGYTFELDDGTDELDVCDAD